MNHKTTGKPKTAGRAKASPRPAASARPTASARPPYAFSKPQTRDVREVKAEAKSESRADLVGRRDQQSTDRAAHKANLNALHKIALEAIRPLATQVQLLHQEAAAKDAEIMALQKRLTRVESELKAREKV